MPIKKAAMKALRQAKKRTLRNNKVKESISFLRRGARKALEAKDNTKAKDVVHATIKALDKAVQNNVLKQNTVSRLKSRLMKKLNALGK